MSQGLVRASMTSPPLISSRARRAMARVEPTTVCNRVVSAVRREMSSPVRLVSKKPRSSPSTREKTATRMSATTRSPIQLSSQERARMAPAMVSTTARKSSRERLRAASEPVLSPVSTTSRITWPKARTAPAATSKARTASSTRPR